MSSPRFTAWRRSLQDQRIYVQQSRQKEDEVPGWPLPNMKGVHIPNCILHSNAAQAPCTLAASLLFSACRRAILQGHRHDQSSHGWASGCRVLYVNIVYCLKAKNNIWVFPQIGVPQIIHFNKVFHYKPSILGYPYFWKHPYILISTNVAKKITPD